MSYDEHIKSIPLDDIPNGNGWVVEIDRNRSHDGVWYRAMFHEPYLAGGGRDPAGALHNFAAKLEELAEKLRAAARDEERTPIELKLAPDLCPDCEGRGTKRIIEQADIDAGQDFLDYLDCETCVGTGRKKR